MHSKQISKDNFLEENEKLERTQSILFNQNDGPPPPPLYNLKSKSYSNLRQVSNVTLHSTPPTNIQKKNSFEGASSLENSSPQLSHNNQPKLNISPKQTLQKSPLVSALALLHNKQHTSSPLANNDSPSDTPPLQHVNSKLKREETPSQDQSVSNVYDIGMLIGFLIKSMWTCETRSSLHAEQMESLSKKATLTSFLMLLFSAVTSGMIWTNLNTCPTPLMTWIMAIISTVATILKSWCEFRNYHTMVNEHTKASREYTRLHTKIDVKLRLRKIKVGDFEKLLNKLMELEFETPLQTSMPEFNPEEYTKKLDKEKVLTSSFDNNHTVENSTTPPAPATRSLSFKNYAHDSDDISIV